MITSETVEKTVDHAFLETAKAIEWYEKGASHEETIAIAIKNIESMGRLISMQCVHASSARFMASLAKEYQAHTNKLMQLLLALKDTKTDVKKVAKALYLEMQEFQAFLTENGLIPKENENLKRVREGLERKNKNALVYIVQSAPNGIKKGLDALFNCIKGGPSAIFEEHIEPDINMVPRIIAAVTLIFGVITFTLANASQILADISIADAGPVRHVQFALAGMIFLLSSYMVTTMVHEKSI